MTPMKRGPTLPTTRAEPEAASPKMRLATKKAVFTSVTFAPYSSERGCRNTLQALKEPSPAIIATDAAATTQRFRVLPPCLCRQLPGQAVSCEASLYYVDPYLLSMSSEAIHLECPQRPNISPYLSKCVVKVALAGAKSSCADEYST